MKIKFMPQNIEYEIEPQQSVMELAHSKGLYIKSICNGVPSCTECRVRILEGENNALPPLSDELELIGTGYFIDQRRLSCQLKCYGDLVIDLEEQNEKEKNENLKRRQKTGVREEKTSHARTGNLFSSDEEPLPNQKQNKERKDRGNL